jgi:hypothetical protein
MPDRATLSLLHSIRLGGVAPVPELSRRSGLSLDVVSDGIEALRLAGWARFVDGALEGWMLTAAGRAEGERLLAAELEAVGHRERVALAHEEFVPLNTRLLQVCTDWQVIRVEGVEVPNDHADEARDIRVLERLAVLHIEARPVVRRLAGALERFGEYEQRLQQALDRTLAGSTEWFTRPGIDSYHTVWFELHEDLLATLGLSRNAEPTRGRELCGDRP